MTNPLNGKHSPEEIAEVVVKLLPDFDGFQYQIASFDLNNSSYLCYEIHKALCFRHEEQASRLNKSGVHEYFYFTNSMPRVDCFGQGTTHEEAIINAMMDWDSKEGKA